MAARKVQLKDNSGNKAYPVTSSACVGMSDGSGSLDSHISKITTEYNVSLFHPTEGIDGGNKYTLETAIAKVPAELRNAGIKFSFLDEEGNLETWEYTGKSWSAGSFARSGISATNMDNSIAFTTSYYGNRIIKELYLLGASENEQYKIYLSKGNDFQITRLSDNTLVARAGGYLNYVSFHEVIAYNNSGITGYVLFDWSNWDNNWIVIGGNTNVPTTYLTKQAFGNLDLCPIIKMFLNYAEANRVKSIENNLIKANYVIPVLGANLFNPNDPYISEINGIIYSGYIFVKGASYLKLRHIRIGGANILHYDEDFNQISSSPSSSYVVQINEDDAYIRFPIFDDYKSRNVLAILGDDNTTLDEITRPYTFNFDNISAQDLKKLSVLYDRLGENTFELLMDSLFIYNLIDKSKFISGYITSTGISSNDAYKCIADYIQVKSGKKYRFSSSLRGDLCYLYDQNKSSLGTITNSRALSNGILTIPEGCYYLRVTAYANSLENAFIINDENWNETINGIPEYGKYIAKESIDLSHLSIPVSDGSVTPEKCTFFGTGTNLFNPNDPDLAEGKYLNTSTGLPTNINSSYNTSGYISIREEQVGQYMVVSNNGSKITPRFYVFCNAEKEVIESGINQQCGIIPENAAYFRFSYAVTFEKIQCEINETGTPTTYSPYKLAISNDYLPDDAGGDSLEILLPEEICVAVGRTIEIYNKQVALCGNADNFHFVYKATNSAGQSIGKMYSDKFSIPATSDSQAGDYTLTLEVLDNNLNTKATANSIIRIVKQPVSIPVQNLMAVGDSLCNKPWLPEIRKLANDMFGEQKITWVGTLNAYAGINGTYPGYADYCKNEGRSGWAAGYYISDGAKFQQIILNVTGVSVAPVSKKQYYIPSKEGGNMTYEVEEVLNENGLPYESNGGTISQISMNQVVNSWSTPAGQATGGTITAVETSQAGDNSITYTSWETPNSNPFWNPNANSGEGAVDFNWYFEQNSIPIPTFMVTMLGMNGHVADDVYEFIRLYMEQVPTSKVIAVIPHFTGDLNYDLVKKRTIFEFNAEICEKLKGMSGVYIASVFLTHDSDHNFYLNEEDINPRNDIMKRFIISDVTHPQNAGYMQYADIVFSTWLAHCND